MGAGPRCVRCEAATTRGRLARGVLSCPAVAVASTDSATDERTRGFGGGAFRGLDPSTVELDVERVGYEAHVPPRDLVAAEEPLEIRIGWGDARARHRRTLTVTMRTPGNDVELAVGFLFAEGIVRDVGDVGEAESCGPPLGPRRIRNVVRVELAPTVQVDPKHLGRSFLTTSSCGLCGKSSLEALARVEQRLPADGSLVPAAVIHALPETLRRAQTVFDRTGGLHAAALFDRDGHLLAVREDVGRHNALDKLIGARLLEGGLPLSKYLILVSGRAGYELVQKAVAAGAPILAAVGAPTSLAADLARDANMTLLGFVRAGRFNIYSGPQRIRGEA
jgi:FdhD protein